MTMTLNERCKNMVIGALVADAAAMGLHWIYDQDHIRNIAPEMPEYTPPDAKNYEGVLAFFAHPTRTVGDCSQYGEQALVMLRALAMGGGEFEQATFAEQFRAHFGYGGAYVGYIDHATRDTLDNFRRFEDAAHNRAKSVPFDGDPKITKALVVKALPLLTRYKADTLNSVFHDALSNSYEESALQAYGMRVLKALTSVPPATGAYDLQLPAIAKLPALVTLLCARGTSDGPQFDDPIGEAIRVTSDHPTAESFGKISAHMMAGALINGTIESAITAARHVATPEAAVLLDQAITMINRDNSDATKHFGMACDLPFGIPSATHNIAISSSFTEAVRQNIYAGGDTCGRAILIGAVMGAVHGVGGAQGIPQGWIDQLHFGDEAVSLLTPLLE